MMKVLNFLVLFLLFAINVQAQQFKTHAVKSGETLYSISKLYRVTPFNILKYNKEIKQGDVLKPNTILVIPMQASASDTSPIPETPKEVSAVKQADEEQDLRTPLRFRTHRVRKKETIYGISRRYEVSVDDIKRYNKELYSAPLKKGMRLEIPVYP
jgi:LysM repeat protein